MINLQRTRAEGSHVSFTELLSDKREEYDEEDKKGRRLGNLEGNMMMMQKKQLASMQAVRSLEASVKEMIGTLRGVRPSPPKKAREQKGPGGGRAGIRR
jgi:hypothetical protein